MGVMAAERKQHPAWEEVPPEPVSFQRLLDLLDRVDTDKPNRAEVIDGQVVVSPAPVYWHEEVCQWLLLSFLEACTANDWAPDTVGEIQLQRRFRNQCNRLNTDVIRDTRNDLQRRNLGGESHAENHLSNKNPEVMLNSFVSASSSR